MSSYQALQIEAAAMVAGTRTKILCPECNGGSSKEISLSLFKDHDGRIAWKCFRASCDYKGNPRGVSGESGKKLPLPRYYTEPFVPLSEQQRYWFRTRFGFEPPCWYSDSQRFVLPVRAPSGSLRGYQAYSFKESVQPKCITYRERVVEPFMHWPRSKRRGRAPEPVITTTVIVEDWFSAQKVMLAGAQSVALLGTTLNEERVEEIRSASQNRQVILALDADAYAKSVRYVIDYGEAFKPPLRVWKLVRDLKYESLDRIRMALNDDRNTNFGVDFR